jgi:hypothetical protein
MSEGKGREAQAALIEQALGESAISTSKQSQA